MDDPCSVHVRSFVFVRAARETADTVSDGTRVMVAGLVRVRSVPLGMRQSMTVLAMTVCCRSAEGSSSVCYSCFVLLTSGLRVCRALKLAKEGPWWTILAVAQLIGCFCVFSRLLVLIPAE